MFRILIFLLFKYFQIIPPPEWCSQTKEMGEDTIFQMCVTQSVQKLPFGCFDVVIKVEAIDEMDEDYAEDLFWKHITKQRMYAISNPMSLFGDECNAWNLDKFTKDDSSIHSKPSA